MHTSRMRPIATHIGLISLFAALCAAGAMISLPLPVSPLPIVIQNMFVILAGLLLGPLEGGAAILLFLALGALGFPVFSGGRGGIAVFAGPSGGYLVGYFVGAVLAGAMARKRSRLASLSGGIAGFIAILACGALGLKLMNGITWTKAFTLGVLPFLIGDVIKCALAVLVSSRLGPLTDSLLGRKPHG